MRNQRTQTLVEAALCVALSVVLNYAAMRLPINVAGGSISLTMLPIAVIAIRRGPLTGAAAGTIFGFLDLLMEPYILVPAQVVLDYPAPYLLFGLGVGVFSTLYYSQKTPDAAARPTAVIIIATLVGGMLRLASHLLSGVIFFSEYAGGQNVWVYSLVYNISYLGPSLLASMLCALFIVPIVDKTVPVPKREAA
ncbi:MAG: energy-coupled thiamine transporter ThiT [Coriobacteriia bacterium]|nr:energy-coupled thiamine transporter ThiT [Coriobacteriia bacterium]